jgi:uncharacterized protein (DUF302 family)
MTSDATGVEPGVITKLSPRPFADTVSRLQELIKAKGLKLFAVIDQRAEAQSAGLDLRDTTLVMFGSPAAGTPVMAAAPLSALDLPLKVLIWADDGQVKVTYYAPEELGSRHGLGQDQVEKLAGIGPLTDALTAG